MGAAAPRGCGECKSHLWFPGLGSPLQFAVLGLQGQWGCRARPAAVVRSWEDHEANGLAFGFHAPWEVLITPLQSLTSLHLDFMDCFGVAISVRLPETTVCPASSWAPGGRGSTLRKLSFSTSIT